MQAGFASRAESEPASKLTTLLRLAIGGAARPVMVFHAAGPVAANGDAGLAAWPPS